jgi:dolichol kinase
VAHALCLDSKAVADDLYRLIRTLDPVSWRGELEAAARELLEAIERRLRRALDRSPPAGDRRLQDLRRRMRVLAEIVGEFRARHDLSLSVDFSSWRTLLRRVRPAYQGIAGSLRANAIEVANLRPTNYKRNAVHALAGLGCLLLLQHVFSRTQTIWLTGGWALICWILEALRRRNARLNRGLMWTFEAIAHPHEHHRVNSATWFSSALLFLALLMPRMASSVALVVLAVADPLAGMVGRRWGRLPLRAGRTLEGTTAFVVAGTLAAFAVLSVYYGQLGWQANLQLAVAAALCGALAELFSWRIDDNLAIPVAVSLSVVLASGFVP